MPQLFAVVKNKLYKYNNVNQKDSFMEFLHIMQNPIKELNTQKEIETFIDDKGADEVRIVGFFYDDDRDEASDWMQYERAALKLANWVKLSLARVTD